MLMMRFNAPKEVYTSISASVPGEAKRQKEIGPPPSGHQLGVDPASRRGHQGGAARMAAHSCEDLPRGQGGDLYA